MPDIGRVLFIDGAAGVAGGIGSASSNTAYIEAAAGVGEGARTGFANLVTGGLFGLALFLTPMLTIAGFLSYVVIKTVLGRAREVNWLLWAVSALFLVYFAIDPVEQLLGVK